MYAAERAPGRRSGIVTAGKRLAELDAVLDQPGADAYERHTGCGRGR